MKRTLIIVTIFLLICFLTGCGHIEDTNGESTELTTISLEKLSGKTISARTSGVSTATTRNNITIVTQFEDIDLDSLVMKGGLTSGVSSIMATEIKQGNRLRIDSFTSVESGNLGLILISPNNEVLYNFAIGEEDSCEITAQEAGIYMVRMGAESFTGEINLARTINLE